MALHPPASFPPPPEYCGLRPASRSEDRKAPPLGSTSLIAASTGSVHHSAGSPDPAVKFRPRRFSRPRRFAPPPAFAGLFHPAATSRVCPSGVSPSPRSRTGFPRPFHALWLVGRICLRFDPRQLLRPPSHALLPLNAGTFDQLPRPRLQGLAPRAECGAGRGGLDPGRSAPLMGFCSPGSSPRATWGRFHVPSALDLHRDEPTAAGPRRFAVARIGLPEIRLPTRSSFLA